LTDVKGGAAESGGRRTSISGVEITGSDHGRPGGVHFNNVIEYRTGGGLKTGYGKRSETIRGERVQVAPLAALLANGQEG
jgi:hypothetical protein